MTSCGVSADAKPAGAAITPHTPAATAASVHLARIPHLPSSDINGPPHTSLWETNSFRDVPSVLCSSHETASAVVRHASHVAVLVINSTSVADQSPGYSPLRTLNDGPPTRWAPKRSNPSNWTGRAAARRAVRGAATPASRADRACSPFSARGVGTPGSRNPRLRPEWPNIDRLQR